jgi:pimeloyl-ACP methyl ester carboxylesterase
LIRYARQSIESNIDRLPQQTTVLALFGSFDWLAPTPKEAERFANAVSSVGARVTLGEIPRAGHHLYLENSASFNEAVNRFQRELCLTPDTP